MEQVHLFRVPRTSSVGGPSFFGSVGSTFSRIQVLSDWRRPLVGRRLGPQPSNAGSIPVGVTRLVFQQNGAPYIMSALSSESSTSLGSG
jgi:hypothetical protein